MNTDFDWSLRAANEIEFHRVTNLLRLVTMSLLAVGVVCGVVLGAFLDGVGAPAFGFVTFVVAPILASLLSRRYRAARSKPLEASVVVGMWLAKEGLVDGEGRLSAAARDYLDATRGGQDEAAQSSAGRHRGWDIALSAYVDARQRWRDGRPWLDPFRQAVAEIDTTEVTARMSEDVAKKQRVGLPKACG